jgi:hypothetical protein
LIRGNIIIILGASVNETNKATQRRVEMHQANVNDCSKQINHLLYPPLNDVEAAEFLGVGKQTLRNWRSCGKGPAYLKLSPGPRGRVGYLLEDLQAYRDKRRIDPEAYDETFHST